MTGGLLDRGSSRCDPKRSQREVAGEWVIVWPLCSYDSLSCKGALCPMLISRRLASRATRRGTLPTLRPCARREVCFAGQTVHCCDQVQRGMCLGISRSARVCSDGVSTTSTGVERNVFENEQRDDGRMRAVAVVVGGASNRRFRECRQFKSRVLPLPRRSAV